MPRRYSFGQHPDGRTIEAIEIGSSDAIQVRLLTYGANLAALRVPGVGSSRNVVLGHDEITPYFRSGPVNGAVVGRYANRIANGRFVLDGQVIVLDANLSPHTIHGGSVGFANRIWQAELEGNAVVMRLQSADGDQGFPGNLDVSVRYEITGNGLAIRYEATTDAPTVINLTNHAYFNLSGNDTIRDHRISIAANHVLDAGADGIPTGTLKAVTNTPFDLRSAKLLADTIDLPDPALRQVGGYDHHFVFSRPEPDMTTPVATASADGLRLELFTSEPGMQLYTGNFLKRPNRAHSGFCFETQHAPDSPNNPEFPTTILRSGSTYASDTVFNFVSDSN